MYCNNEKLFVSLPTHLDDDAPLPGGVLIKAKLGEIVCGGEKIEDVLVVELEEGDSDTELGVLLYAKLVEELRQSSWDYSRSWI